MLNRVIEMVSYALSAQHIMENGNKLLKCHNEADDRPASWQLRIEQSFVKASLRSQEDNPKFLLY